MAVSELPKQARSREPSREDVRLAFEVVGLVGLLLTLYYTELVVQSLPLAAPNLPRCREGCHRADQSRKLPVGLPTTARSMEAGRRT